MDTVDICITRKSDQMTKMILLNYVSTIVLPKRWFRVRESFHQIEFRTAPVSIDASTTTKTCLRRRERFQKFLCFDSMNMCEMYAINEKH